MVHPVYPDILAAADAPSRDELLWWHVGWGVTLLVAAVGFLLVLDQPPAYLTGALGAALVPCLVAAVLLIRDHWRLRATLLVVWAASGCAAAVLTGGVSGPLAAWCLTPVAAAAVVGGSGYLAQAAALSLMAACVAVVAQLAGLSPAPPSQPLSFWLGLLSLSTTGVWLGAGLLIARRSAVRQSRALGRARATAETLLALQPHLLMQLEPGGRVVAAYGRPPRGVHLDRLADAGVIVAAVPAEADDVRRALDEAMRLGEASVSFSPADHADRRLALDLRRGDDGLMAGVLRDASREWSREAALEQAKLDAESLATGKSRFLANMSHELRTPLNAIMGFSDIMRAKMFGELPGKYIEYAQLIHESGRHLLDLINDVLDMSKIEAQRYDLNREVLDAREPVSAALRIVRLQADEAGVQLRGVLPSQPLDANADRRALKQIVLNLVSNALKFTPAGGSVTVTVQAVDGELQLVVADSGVGIAEEDLARLGRPYEQAGDADKMSLGTGLGLSLVRAFAELHGGQMSIESRLGEGTAVTVRLPVLLPLLHAAPNVVAFKTGG